jgi:peptidoglycan DL-endopeptidase LytF
MNRRDVIIVAVLLNAGLLAILFMMAINVEEEVTSEGLDIQKGMVVEEVQSKPQEEIAITMPSEAVVDDLDNALKDYNFTMPSQELVMDEESNLIEEEKVVHVPKAAKLATDPRYVDVTVKRGDALEKIARANGTTIETIKKANALTSEKLSVGQVLRVPMGNPSKEVAAVEPKKKVETGLTSGEAEYYTVKSGDNPWKIAKQFHIKLDDLLKLNNLNEEKARNLKVGDRIRVK